jgi:hypothetical protein
MELFQMRIDLTTLGNVFALDPHQEKLVKVLQEATESAIQRDLIKRI